MASGSPGAPALHLLLLAGLTLLAAAGPTPPPSPPPTPPPPPPSTWPPNQPPPSQPIASNHVFRFEGLVAKEPLDDQQQASKLLVDHLNKAFNNTGNMTLVVDLIEGGRALWHVAELAGPDPITGACPEKAIRGVWALMVENPAVRKWERNMLMEINEDYVLGKLSAHIDWQRECENIARKRSDPLSLADSMPPPIVELTTVSTLEPSFTGSPPAPGQATTQAPIEQPTEQAPSGALTQAPLAPSTTTESPTTKSSQLLQAEMAATEQPATEAPAPAAAAPDAAAAAAAAAQPAGSSDDTTSEAPVRSGYRQIDEQESLFNSSFFSAPFNSSTFFTNSSDSQAAASAPNSTTAGQPDSSSMAVSDSSLSTTPPTTTTEAFSPDANASGPPSVLQADTSTPNTAASSAGDSITTTTPTPTQPSTTTTTTTTILTTTTPTLSPTSESTIVPVSENDVLAKLRLDSESQPNNTDGLAEAGTPAASIGKYVGLGLAFLIFVAYLICSRAFNRQGMYELHNE